MPEISDQDYRTYLRLTDIASRYDGAEGITRKIAELEKDVGKERERRTAAEDKAKVLADGAVVLKADEAPLWDAVKKLGATPEQLTTGKIVTGDALTRLDAWEALNLKPEEVATVQKERDELKQKDAARTRQDAITAAVEAMGWPKDTAATLADLKSLDGATFEVKTEKGKNTKGEDADLPVAYVTITGQQPVKLSEFAAKTESLKGLRTTTAAADAQEDRSYPDQSTGGGSTGYDPAAAGKKMAEAQKNNAGDASLALR